MQFTEADREPHRGFQGATDPLPSQPVAALTPTYPNPSACNPPDFINTTLPLFASGHSLSFHSHSDPSARTVDCTAPPLVQLAPAEVPCLGATEVTTERALMANAVADLLGLGKPVNGYHDAARGQWEASLTIAKE